MARKKKVDDVAVDMEKDNSKELQDFPIDVKREIADILIDSPTIVRLGDKEYTVKNLRMYSVMRISKLCMAMKQANSLMVDNDNKILTAMCTDLDAMCEIMAIILCNHLFTADGELTDLEGNTRNEHYISVMKNKVLNSTFEINQWAAIILGALRSVDWGGFFFLTKSVSTLTVSMMSRKKKSAETASQFTEALSLRTQPTS